MSQFITITPDPAGSVDFVKSTYDTHSKLWFKNPQPAWIDVLSPSVISAAASGSDLLFSTFRKNLPLTDPRSLPLPNGGNYTVRMLLPVGKPFAEELFTTLTWFSATEAPIADTGREGIFSCKAGALHRRIEDFFRHDKVDRLRKIGGRVREELWVLWSARALEICPECVPIPKWRQQIDPDAPGAQEAMNAFRAPMPASEYHRLRMKEKAERDAKAEVLKAGNDLLKSPPNGGVSGKTLTPAESPAEVPGQAEPVAAAIVEAEATPANPAPPVPHTMSTEERREKKRVKAKLSRATKSKQRADRFNAQAAKEHAQKAVKRMEAAGKL
jgi:hypothetical protein